MRTQSDEALGASTTVTRRLVCLNQSDQALGTYSDQGRRLNQSDQVLSALALHDADRPQARDPRGEAGAVDDLDDALDVLVGLGCLLGESAC